MVGRARFLLLQWAGLSFDHDIISSIMRTKVLTVKRGECRDLLPRKNLKRLFLMFLLANSAHTTLDDTSSNLQHRK